MEALIEALGTEPALREAGIDFIRLDGSTANRGAVAERFQEPEGPPVD